MKRHAHESAARALLASVLVCASLCWATLAGAEEETRQYDIDIAELPLSQALEAFSKQTGLQYGYLPTDDEEERLMVGPVRGHLTASEVLTKLLPDGFKFEWINPRTISIVSPPVNSPPPGGVNQALAEEDKQRSEMSEDQKLAMENGGGKSGSARGPYAFDGRMLVEATRIFDGGLDLDVPGTVLNREDIEASGASNLADLMLLVTQQPHMMSDRYLGDGTQFADLRGLGFDTTLVLINGRRIAATASALGVNAFDVNTIPLTAVDRVEIVSDSFSAPHGADAIGGVVNIRLRDSVPEPRLDLDYGAAQGGGVERRGAFSASLRGTRANAFVVLDYFNRSPLLGAERDRWSDQDFTRFGSIDWRSPSASPGNVSSLTSDNLPGLTSGIAVIPFSTAGTILTPQDFVATAGQRHLESLYSYESIHFDTTRKSAMVQVSYQLAPVVSAFGETLYVRRNTSIEHSPSALSGVIVPAHNPYNPFGEPVGVDLLMTEVGPQVVTRDAEMFRVVTGLRGRARQLDWELSLLRNEDEDASVRTNELDLARVATALDATEPDKAFNPFGPNKPEVLTSLRAPRAEGQSFSGATQALGYLRGTLFDIPSGHVQTIVGGEWREERVRYRIPPPVGATGSHARSVSATFGELRLPVVESGRSRTEALAVVVSGRFDRYSDIGDSFNRQYALVWHPTPAWTFRSSYSTGFRPPPLFDLYFPRVDIVVPTADPRRNGELAFPEWRAGGNPNLQASSAESIVTGFVFAPSSLSRLRIAANYWRISIDDAIGIPTAQAVLAAESAVNGRVVRADPTPADVAAGLPGMLEIVDLTRINYGSIRTSGIDGSFSITLETPLGIFAPSLSATWVDEFTTSDLSTGPNVDRVGVASLQGSMAEWRVVAGVRWSRPGIALNATARYVSAYDDVNLFGDRNGQTVGSQFLLDTQLAVDLETMVGQSPLWSGMELKVGAVNLLNKEPPFAEVGLLAGYDQSQADLRQRFAYVKLSKKF